MGLFEHFPYTNFHDMNTDWLVKVAKEFMDKYETLQDTIDTATTGITELAETLEAQLNAWYTTHSADIANQLADSLTAISNALNSATSAIATDRNSAEMAIASARANSITAIENKLTSAENDFDDHADEYGAEVIASLPPDYLNSLYGAHMVYPQHTKGVTGAMAHVAKIMVGKRLVPPPNPEIVDDATSNIIVFETGKGFVHGTMAVINRASSAFVSYPTEVQNLAGIASTDYLIVNESGFDYLDLDFMSDGMPEYAYRKYEDVHVTNFSTGSSISAQPTSYNGTNKAFTPFRMTGTLNVTGAVFAGLYNPETGAYIRTVTEFPVTVEDNVVMVFSETPNNVVIQVNDEGGGGGTEGAVLYSEAQNLTTLEKTQAKVNIGANFDNDINTLQTTALALTGRVDDVEEETEDLKNAIKDICNISYTKESGYIANAGDISPASSNNEVYTSRIPAIAGQSFAFRFKSSTTNLGNWCAYALYDGSNNFISRTVFISNVLGSEVSQIITIPQTSQTSNARYIAFTWRNFNDGAETITVSNLNKVLSQVKSECISPLILSQTKNYVDITITDTASSIKFPADVLACTNAGYVQITATETEIDISSSVIATTAIKVVYNLNTNQFELCAYNVPLSPQQILIASIRRHTSNPSIFIGCNYVLNGKPFGIDFINNHAHVRSINHRGYYTAPENTLPAFILSKQKGFNYVECDVEFTSDSVPVLLHDATINRTARNADGSVITQEININDITYEQALQYDFGIYKSASYAGTKIPTLAQFIGLCKNLGLYPYIELKYNATYSEAQISGLIDIVKSYGMLRDVTWISFSNTYLGYVKTADSNARLGLVCGDITTTVINNATALKNSTNDVFIDAYYFDPAHQVGNIPSCISAGIPVEVWTPDTSEAIEGMNPYITGVTSNRLVASSVLYANAIE